MLEAVSHATGNRSVPQSINSHMDILVNGQRRALDAGLPDVASLVRALGLEGKRIAVERNGAIVPKSRYAETPIREGDRLEIVGAVGGG